MAYLAQPTSKIDYGVVAVGDNINVTDGFIWLEQDVSPAGIVSFAQVTVNGSEVVTTVTPSSGDGIQLTDVINAGNATSFKISNTGVLSVSAGAGISVSGSTGNITISSFGADLISTIGVTGDYTATATDEYIGVYSASNVKITLPVGITGRVYTIKDEYGQNAGKITIQPSASEKIDNRSTYVIFVPNQAVTVVFRGGQWRII